MGGHATEELLDLVLDPVVDLVQTVRIPQFGQGGRAGRPGRIQQDRAKRFAGPAGPGQRKVVRLKAGRRGVRHGQDASNRKILLQSASPEGAHSN
ncbi:hypothetical protein GCM10010371_47470 [Streptomyces subrutilus]|uniref:Uncharacterized protein n=1 Tax=Streptomyces subrutilus TaxID=36818 RepID=A0A918R288_9ACTN|nr:hypothetical protein GCM10010371_47470 [Streptomyces subrutilus]